MPPSAHIEGGDPRPVDYPEDKGALLTKLLPN